MANTTEYIDDNKQTVLFGKFFNHAMSWISIAIQMSFQGLLQSVATYLEYYEAISRTFGFKLSSGILWYLVMLGSDYLDWLQDILNSIDIGVSNKKGVNGFTGNSCC